MGEVKSSFPLIWASSPCTDAISFLFIQIERDRRTSRRPRCRSALGPRAGMLAPNAVQRRQAKRESPKRRRQYRQEHLRWCGEGHRQSLFSLPFFTLTRFGLRQLLARSTAIRNAWKARQAQHQQPQPPSSVSAHTSRLPPLPRPPHAEIKYGALAPSPWSKVGGPPIVAGMKR